MWQYMLLRGVGAKPDSSMTLTLLNLHQKTPKGATTKIQVKRHKRDVREIK